MTIEIKKLGIFLLTAVQQILPTLTLSTPDWCRTLKLEFVVMNMSNVFSFLPAWIWAFGVSSHSHSHELEEIKWCPWSKDHVSHLVDKTMYEAVFTREKRMFCSIMAPVGCCTTHVLLVYFYKWTGKHHWSMDAWLVSFFRGRWQSRQFMLYLQTDFIVHKISVLKV